MTDDELREWKAGLLYGSRVGVRCPLDGSVISFGTLRDELKPMHGCRRWMIVWDSRHYETGELYEEDMSDRYFVPLPYPGAHGWMKVDVPKKPRRRRGAPKAPAGQATA